MVKCTPYVGYLHRGIEKICEFRDYNQVIPKKAERHAIALWAMTRAPVASVAALRETSVLFATLIGAPVLKTRTPRARPSGPSSSSTTSARWSNR